MWGKKYNRVFVSVLCVLISFALILVLKSQTIYAQGESAITVKVGKFPYENQMTIDAHGNYSGYGYDYLQKVARYTGWEYEFVNVPWQDGLKKLENGEIDLLGAVMYSKEREKVFDFSDYPMVSGYGALVTALDNKTLPYEDFSAFNGLKVGVLDGNLHRESFLEYSENNNFTPNIIAFNSQQEMEAALENGDICAMVSSNILRSQTLRVVATFGGNDAYFATGKDRLDILEPLNDAMEKIKLSDPYFNSKLDEKYYDLQASTVVSFTQEELDFIENLPPITCAYIPDAPPINYLNSTTKSVEGIAVDVSKLLEEHTGLKFRWVNSSTAKEAADMLSSGEVLLLPAKYHNHNWARKNNAVMSEPYLLGQMVMITNGQTNQTPVVALYDQDLQSQIVANAISEESEIKIYSSILECMNAIINDDANTTFVNATVASYLLNDPKYAMMQSSPVYGYSADIAMAISNEANPLLLSVINKGLSNISSTEINSIVLSQTQKGQASAVATFLYLHPVEIIMAISFSLLALIITLSIFLLFWKKQAKKLNTMLYTDALTNYSNYNALSLSGEKLIKEKVNQYALLYMDIHRFKVINDALGYEVGDKVLIATSDIINEFIEDEEEFARLYADTFILLLKYETLEKLREKIEILSKKLEKLNLKNLYNLKPIFRGGVYLLAEDFNNIDEACDRANYAKDSIAHPFSNTFIFYDDVIRDKILVEKELELSMSKALEREEFIPYYQPKINAVTEKVIGAEALVRWQHPEKGYLMPGEFLPFYEKNGFIVNIDLAIFEQVCKDMCRYAKEGKPLLPISVNFSRRNTSDKTLPQKLKNIADKYKIPTKYLEIEITETQELENVDVAVNFVDSLKSLGFSVSIDDYGTGYSSISFLQELPLDTLKLDRKFILNAMKTDKARDIMRYLITSMQKNGICIMCEGIETIAQKEFVMSLNCRYIQGYLYSKPLPRIEFEKYIGEHGIDTSDNLDFITLGNFDKDRWAGANDFLMRAVPSWIVCCKAEQDYPIEYISPNFLEGMGYSELEFNIATKGLYTNWIHPDDIEYSTKPILLNKNAGQDSAFQYRLRKKDGTYVHIREINKRVTIEDGTEVIFCICTDVSDLVALEAENSQLINAVPGGVGKIELTPNGPIIKQASDAFYKVIGHTQEEIALLNNNLGRIMYEKDLPEAMSTIGNILATDQNSCNCTFRIKHKDESYHWITFRGTISRGEEQIYATVIIYNCDEEMQVKQRENISKAKLELALDLTENAIFECDLKSQAIYSHSGLDKYGIADGIIIDNIKDMFDRDIIHPDDDKKIKDALIKLLEGEKNISCEVRVHINTGDLQYIWIKVALTTIFDEDNQPVRAIGIIENINDKKHLEHAFHQESLYRRAFTKSTLMAYEFNLTQNYIGRITGTRAGRLQEVISTLPNPNNYTDVLMLSAKLLVKQEDREIFLKTESLENLANLYNNGIFETELEYRRLTQDGKEMWNNVFISLLKDPLSNDIMGYAYHKDIHRRKQAEINLINRASKDPLTYIYNRSTGEKLMQEYLENQANSNCIQAFLMFDVDKFKKINDTFGHISGDKLLTRLAQILTRNISEENIATRMGGDEFAVLLKNLSSKEEAISIAKKIEKDILEMGHEIEDGLTYSVSIGIAYTPCHGKNFDSLYRCADEAMYKAKKQEGTQIEVAENL